MAFFNPKLPIMARVEATYNEGLSGLSQQSTRGWQPMHFITCRMTDVEQRYSQTEKDALCVQRAKDQFSILLGVPRFVIVTAHKPHQHHSALLQQFDNYGTIILTNLSYLFCCLTEKFVI